MRGSLHEMKTGRSWVVHMRSEIVHYYVLGNASAWLNMQVEFESTVDQTDNQRQLGNLITTGVS